jgi:chromosome partitioning protein
MRVGSGPGLGWPDESRSAGWPRTTAAPGGAARAQEDGVGWPAASANGSGSPIASGDAASPRATAESWAEYVARPAAGHGSTGAGADVPQAVAGLPPDACERRPGGERALEASAGAEGSDEEGGSCQAPPERVRQALASVSRETAAAGAAQPGHRSVDAASSASSAGRSELTGEQAPNPAGGMRAGASPDSVGGAEYASAGESEVQVAIPAVPDAVADTPIARAAQAAVVARSGGAPWPRPSSCRIITIANQKGGVGKTTTAVNMAASLAMHGARVLVVDLDPQGNASTALDVDHHSGIASVYNVLVDGQPLASVVKQVSGFPQLYCAPAAIDLAGAEIELVPLVARESRLARALSAYDATNLDYIFIDCPPSLGLLTVNALVAAPEVLIPIQCEYYALEGLEQLLRTVELVRSHLNPALSVTTILLTMYDGRTRLASQVADEVREHFGAVVLGSVIPRSVRVSEAPSYGQSVMTYDPGSTGALAYLEAARELAQRNAAPAAS